MADGGGHWGRSPGGVIVPERKVVWSPLQGSQELVLSCPCHHILYEGTRGPGKTDAQLLKFRRHVGMGYGRFWRGVIFDREYKNLDDLVIKSQRWFPAFNDGARFLGNGKDYKWVWPTGEELLFRTFKKTQDYWDYHGHEFPYIGWNELTKYATSECYDMMMSCNRSSFRPEDYPIFDHDTGEEVLIPEIPLVVFSTTNPFGSGHAWVKRRFIDVAPPGKVVRNTTNIYNPRTKKREDITKTQVRIFGSYKENKYLTPEAIAELENIKDPNRRKAWLWGDWEIVSGGALNDLWHGETHIAERFRIPKGWRVDRSFDWGQAKPFSVGWWAEANGEEAHIPLPDGTVGLWSPPPGTLVRIFEYYGTEELGTNKGLKLSDRKVAQAIKKIDDALLQHGWIQKRVQPGPADNMIFDVKPVDDDTEPNSIAAIHASEGVEWTRSDKSAGSRKNGLSAIRERLEAALDFEGPGLYVMRNCAAFLELVPNIQRSEEDPDDVDSDTEDHIYDEVRYRVLAGGNRSKGKVKVNFGR